MKRRLLWGSIGPLLVAVLILTQIRAGDAAAADGLTLPFQVSGIAVNSWFDHNIPTYPAEPYLPFVRYDGYSDSSSNALCIFPGGPCNCSPGTNCYNGHDGIDFGLSLGSSVVAAAPGTVTARYFDSCSGWILVVWHSTLNYSTQYVHLKDPPIVSLNDSVLRGQSLGLSGGTGIGCSKGAHLHFGVVASSGAVVDPYGWSGGGADPWGYDIGYLWASNPPVTAGWQPPAAYEAWLNGAWGSESVTAAAVDRSQAKFVALARISAGVPQWRQYLGGSTWSNWTTISGLTGVDGQIGISNHRNGTQEQVHFAAVKNGDMWYSKKVASGSWTSWTNLSHPVGITFNGAVAISNSDLRVVVAGVSGGNVYVRLWYNGSWGSWVNLEGGATLTGSIAISTRPNGMYHIVALRSDGVVFIKCSVNYASWWGWSSIGGTMGGGLSVDNDSANGICDVNANNPGVHVAGIGNNIAYVRCWDPQCPQSAYDPLGPTVGAPSAISNSVNPFLGSSRWVDVAVRSGNDELHRNRVY